MKKISKSLVILIICTITWINLDLKRQSDSNIDLSNMVKFANAQDESGAGYECYTINCEN